MWSPPYCTAAELAHFMGDAAATDDAELTLAIETASRSVDRACNRQFGVVDAPEPRWYPLAFDSTSPFGPQRRWTADVDDLMSTTALVVESGDGASVAGEPISGVIPAPVNAVVNGRP